MEVQTGSDSTIVSEATGSRRDVPKQMRALVLDGVGFEHLRVTKVPTPVPGPRQMLASTGNPECQIVVPAGRVDLLEGRRMLSRGSHR